MDLSFLAPIDIQDAKYFLEKQGLKDNESNTRANILSCWESVDIPSCPGSGKTTILVTKLAWAIERWKADSEGICVLSHTNVAKEEIKKRLTTRQSNKLLTYPHFVGTIHEFFNKFLALPWLRERNIPIRHIDNELGYQKCLDEVWFVGDKTKFDKTYKNNFLRQNHIQNEKFTNLSWTVDNLGKFQVLNSKEEFSEFQKLLKKSATNSGYHTHDDMLAFSKRLLFEFNDLSNIISSRFPVVLIDEAQDTNESQSSLLSTLLDPQKSVVQRFGDTDQQIFDFGDKAITDAFPVRHKSQLILNETQRCNSHISNVASKFSLSGNSINSVVEYTDKQQPPHLILFDRSTSSKVIDKFAELVSNNVNLQKDAVIKIVGQVGQGVLDDKKFPQTICHYEATYTKPVNMRLGRPKNIHDLIKNTKILFAENSENYQALNMFFSGMLRLLADELKISFGTPYPFRNISEQLEAEEMNSNGLKGRDLLDGLMEIYNEIINSDLEHSQIKQKLEELLGRTGVKKYNKSFLNNSATQKEEQSNTIAVNGIPLELNTIAGIKGETHTATLILETFFYKHNIEDAIRTMLIGSAKEKNNDRSNKRIKHLYVAMTRPTDFLCLALPHSAYLELCKNQTIKSWIDVSFSIDKTLLSQQ